MVSAGARASAATVLEGEWNTRNDDGPDIRDGVERGALAFSHRLGRLERSVRAAALRRPLHRRGRDRGFDVLGLQDDHMRRAESLGVVERRLAVVGLNDNCGYEVAMTSIPTARAVQDG